MQLSLKVDSKVEREAMQDIDKFLKEIAMDLQNELKMETPVDRGRLRQSIHLVNMRKGAYKVAINAPYAMAIQKGTEAYTPPLEPIKDWAERKLGSREAGGAVWQKIRQEGIDANPFISRALENLEAKYR